MCKRLPNYQSWFSTSLNFLIGLPFWLPLITRFHIPLMIEGERHVSVHILSHTYNIHPDRHTHIDTYAPMSMSTRLIFYLSLRSMVLCVFLSVQIKPFFSTTRSFIKQFMVSLFSYMLFCSPAASLPIRRTEETAGARHRSHHPTGEQLVSHFRVYMQSISGVCSPRLSQFLMIGINASTPPLFSHTHTTYRIILT